MRITFIIEKDGHLSNFKVVKAPSESLGQAALKAVKASPAWSPGIKNGKPVRVQYSIPISFNLSTAKRFNQ